MVCFENHAEWIISLAPIWCVAPGWRSGARARCCFLPFVLALYRSRVRTTSTMSHATAISRFSQNKSYPSHHLQQGYETNLLFVLTSEIGEVDAATAAQQVPIPVQVNVPVVPELSLGQMTQVWTLGVGSDRRLGRPKEWNGETRGFDDFAFKFSNWLSVGFQKMPRVSWRNQ